MPRRDEWSWEKFYDDNPDFEPAPSQPPRKGQPKDGGQPEDGGRKQSVAAADAEPKRGPEPAREEIAAPEPAAEASPAPPSPATYPQQNAGIRVDAGLPGTGREGRAEAAPIDNVAWSEGRAAANGIVTVNIGGEHFAKLKQRAVAEGRSPENLAARLVVLGLRFLRSKP